MSEEFESTSHIEVASQLASVDVGVMGLGGCGNNTINSLKRSGVEVLTVAVNTDAAVLAKTVSDVHILIGESLVKGRGSAGSPSLGRRIAQEDIESILAPIKDKELILLVAGFGGGTGTGSLPVVAEALKENHHDKLVISVVTLPFSSEGPSRKVNAQTGLSQTMDVSDMTLVQSNDLLKERAGNLPITQAFREMDRVLLDTIESIVSLQGIVPQPGLVNLDFSNFAAMIRNSGLGFIGIGKSRKLMESFMKALRSNYCEADLRDANGAMIYLEGRQEMLRMNDMQRIPSLLSKEFGIKTLFWGIKPNWRVNGIQATLTATGIKSPLVEEYLRGEA